MSRWAGEVSEAKAFAWAQTLIRAVASPEDVARREKLARERSRTLRGTERSTADDSSLWGETTPARSRTVEESPALVEGRWWEAAEDEADERPGGQARSWADFTIELSNGTLTRIEEEIRAAIWAHDYRDDFETGGWLYAHYAPRSEHVKVVAATGPGPHARFGSTDEHLDLTISSPSSCCEDDYVPGILVGDWHSHPWPSRDHPTDQASDADETAWRNRRETYAAGRPYVSVIFTPGPQMGWAAPAYYGYVTHENDDGVVVCEQATVVEERVSPGSSNMGGGISAA
jgi:hypothetical protein